MMGRQEAAPQLFYDFRLEDHVPADHILRADSDEDAHPFRFDGARVSDMMSPIWHRLAGCFFLAFEV
jgi:hypothetical protein